MVRDNSTAFWYYVELALPILALAVLAVSRDAFRPGWPDAVPKVGVVAVLGILLNAGFLRSPLDARLADPSVPHAIVIAWLAGTVATMAGRRQSWRPALASWRVPLSIAAVVAALPLAFVMIATMPEDAYDRLDNAGMTEGVRGTVRHAQSTARGVAADWDAVPAGITGRSELFTLAAYLHACTAPGAHVFVQPYLPHVIALARRPFAGGHADLRTGFFTSDADQQQTLRRLRRQDVPVVLLSEPPASFGASFPLIGAYLLEQYDVAGTYTFDDRFPIVLLWRKGVDAGGRFTALDWPCRR
jgi:hypothetical protein